MVQVRPSLWLKRTSILATATLFLLCILVSGCSSDSGYASCSSEKACLVLARQTQDGRRMMGVEAGYLSFTQGYVATPSGEQGLVVRLYFRNRHTGERVEVVTSPTTVSPPKKCRSITPVRHRRVCYQVTVDIALVDYFGGGYFYRIDESRGRLPVGDTGPSQIRTGLFQLIDSLTV